MTNLSLPAVNNSANSMPNILYRELNKIIKEQAESNKDKWLVPMFGLSTPDSHSVYCNEANETLLSQDVWIVLFHYY